MKEIESIGGLYITALLPGEAVKTALKKGDFRISSYGEGGIIHFDGERCVRLEIILSGKVAIDRIDRDGNLMTISEIYKGEILGGTLLFSKNPVYPMTTSAKTPSRILEIEKTALFNLFLEYPDFLRRYLELVSDRTSILGNKIKYAVNTTIRDKLMRYLSREKELQGTARIRLTMSKKALAERMGIQRTSLSRELARMKKEGIIDFDNRTITLL